MPYQKAYPVDGYPNNENMWIDLGKLTPNAEYSPQKEHMSRRQG